MCSHLVQARQAALKAYDEVTKVGAECERYKSEQDMAHQKAKVSEQHARVAGAKSERLKKELADVKAKAEAARVKVEKMKKEEKKKLKAIDLKGYTVGIIRAAEEYTRVAWGMVNDELSLRWPDFYKAGYKASVTAMANCMHIEPEQGFFKNAHEPVVPDLELSYTLEECEPLPPKEEEDEDGETEVGEDVVVAKQQGKETKADEAGVAEDGVDAGVTAVDFEE